MAVQGWMQASACCLAGFSLAVSGCASGKFGVTDPAAAAVAPAEGGSLLSRLWAPEPPMPRQPVLEVPDKLEDPERLHLAYARWQAEVGNAAEARQAFKEVLKASPENADAIIGVAQLDQAGGRLQEAEQGFQQAVRLRPADARTLSALGEFYASQKRWKEAASVLRAATVQAPDEPVYQSQLAAALASSGDLSEAVALFARTAGEAEAHFKVGYILYQQGRVPEAERCFAQALQKRPDLEPAARMLAQIRGSRKPSAPDTAALPSPLPTSPPVAAQTKPGAERRPAAKAAQAVQPVSAVRNAPSTKKPDQQEFVSAEYKTEQPADSQGWGPTRNRGPETQSAQPGTTPQQREQWANQSRTAGN